MTTTGPTPLSSPLPSPLHSPSLSPSPSPSPLPSREAYATLLTSPDVNYLRGALALASSIRAFDHSGGQKPEAMGQGPGAVDPSHVDPSHVDPSHVDPSHGAPSHVDPSHGAPSHGAPSHGAPSHGAREMVIMVTPAVPPGWLPLLRQVRACACARAWMQNTPCACACARAWMQNTPCACPCARAWMQNTPCACASWLPLPRQERVGTRAHARMHHIGPARAHACTCRYTRAADRLSRWAGSLREWSR